MVSQQVTDKERATFLRSYLRTRQCTASEESPSCEVHKTPIDSLSVCKWEGKEPRFWDSTQEIVSSPVARCVVSNWRSGSTPLMGECPLSWRASCWADSCSIMKTNSLLLRTEFCRHCSFELVKWKKIFYMTLHYLPVSQRNFFFFTCTVENVCNIDWLQEIYFNSISVFVFILPIKGKGKFVPVL
jgi:hypothetical protein